MSNNNVEPAVYVGTYRKYNEGSIFGKWMTLSDYSDYDEFEEACRELHKDEEDPEFMCQDYEGLPKGKYCESGLEWTKFYWDELADLDEDERAIVMEYWDEVYDGTDARQILDSYFGESMDDYDLGVMLAQDALNIPDNLEPYFDYAKYGRDCKYDMHETTNYLFWAY